MRRLSGRSGFSKLKMGGIAGKLGKVTVLLFIEAASEIPVYFCLGLISRHEV
jgi:hypothetical protein